MNAQLIKIVRNNKTKLRINILSNSILLKRNKYRSKLSYSCNDITKWFW